MESLRHASDADSDIGVIPPDQCSPCRKRYGTRSRLADWYCIHCREFICGECKASHEAFSMFSKHKIITQTKGAEAAEIIQEMSEMETCRTHKDKTLEFFCPSHKMFCCSACINQSHKKCRKAIDVQEKNSSNIFGTPTEIRNVLQKLIRQVETKQQQHSSDKRYLGKLKSELKDMFVALKKDVINMLEQAERKVMTEINKMITEKERTYSSLEVSIRALNQNIQKCLSKLKVSLEHGSDTQKILTRHEIEAKASQFRDDVKTMRISTSKPTVEICLQPSFIDLLQDPENIFKVSVASTLACPVVSSSHSSPPSTPGTVARPTSGVTSPPSTTGALATHVPAVTKPFREKQTKFVTEVKCKTSGDKETPWITGCVSFSDSRLVTADNLNKKLKLFDQDLSLVNELVLDDDPWDLTAYDKEDVAVTFPRTKKVKLVSAKKVMSIKQTLTVPYMCYGISSINKNRLIVAAEEVGVVILNLNGSEISRVRCDEDCLKDPYYVALNDTKTVAYVSSWDCNKVCAVNLSSNKVLLTYQHSDLHGPCGVVVDKDGNVYVCGNTSHNVHQISHDGHLIKILLSNKDGIQGPQSLCFSITGKRLFVTEYFNVFFKTFDLD